MKRGQITTFVIIAVILLLIVVSIVAVVQMPLLLRSETRADRLAIEQCLTDLFGEKLEAVGRTGGVPGTCSSTQVSTERVCNGIAKTLHPMDEQAYFLRTIPTEEPYGRYIQPSLASMRGYIEDKIQEDIRDQCELELSGRPSVLFSDRESELTVHARPQDTDLSMSAYRTTLNIPLRAMVNVMIDALIEEQEYGHEHTFGGDYADGIVGEYEKTDDGGMFILRTLDRPLPRGDDFVFRQFIRYRYPYVFQIDGDGSSAQCDDDILTDDFVIKNPNQEHDVDPDDPELHISCNNDNMIEHISVAVGNVNIEVSYP